jgi:hypothetical protein
MFHACINGFYEFKDNDKDASALDLLIAYEQAWYSGFHMHRFNPTYDYAEHLEDTCKKYNDYLTLTDSMAN